MRRERDRAVDERGDGIHRLGFLGRDERDRPPRATGPAGTADAVDIVLGIIRHVEVDDVGNGLDVEAAPGHVAADEEIDLAALERRQRLGPAILNHVAVQRADIQAMAPERGADDIDVLLPVAEDQRALHRLVSEQVTQHSAFFRQIEQDHRVAHGACHRGRRRDAHFLGVDQKLLAEPLDLGPEGGGEHQRLADTRQGLDDALDIGDEAHVEHAVGLVDHQNLDAAQHDPSALEHVDQAAGSRDQNIRVLAERGLLKREALAAD